MVYTMVARGGGGWWGEGVGVVLFWCEVESSSFGGASGVELFGRGGVWGLFGWVWGDLWLEVDSAGMGFFKVNVLQFAEWNRR
ncbi:hypothetical protein Tco_0695774 [Tanacetum coccineum]